MASTTLTRPPQETTTRRKERCDRCRYWEEPAEEEKGMLRYSLSREKFVRRLRFGDSDLGFCHRFPPTNRSGFPLTYGSEWCGEFR